MAKKTSSAKKAKAAKKTSSKPIVKPSAKQSVKPGAKPSVPRTKAAAMTAKSAMTATAAPVEFQNIPLDRIVIEDQIRTHAGIDDEDSQGFVDSIAAKGVLEPIIVTPWEDKFFLLAGERRCLACRKLGIETIPARILTNVSPGEDVLAIQLIENLQRLELDPLDKANAIYAFFRNRHEEMELEAVLTTLVTFDRDPGRVENAFAETVSAILKYVGMTTRTIENLLSLLKLPPEIGDAVKTGAIPVSQGYILAANLDNPGLMTVFTAILANPVTNKQLTELLKKAAQAGAATPGEAPSPFRSVYTAGQTLSNRLLDGKVRYDLAALEELRLYFLSLIEVIEKAKAGGGTAKEPDAADDNKLVS